MWENIFRKKSETWFFQQLTPTQVPGNFRTKRVEPGKEYLSIKIMTMHIVDVRKGFSNFYGAVHSFISIPYKDGSFAQFNVLTTPTQLQKVDGTNVDKVIIKNIPLLARVPYQGGTVTVEMGLFSIKEENLAAPFLSLLSNMAQSSSVSFISKTIPFLEPLRQGIDIITGSDKVSALEIGLSTFLDEINTGYYVIIKAPKDKMKNVKFKLDEDFTLIDENGSLISDYAYIVFMINSEKDRGDFFSIPEISSTYNKLQADINSGNHQSAQDSLVVFKRMALTSKDLIFEDAKTICSKVEAEAKEIIDLTKTSEFRPVTKQIEIKKLSNLEDMGIFG
jgi:hypothetical protein